MQLTYCSEMYVFTILYSLTLTNMAYRSVNQQLSIIILNPFLDYYSGFILIRLRDSYQHNYVRQSHINKTFYMLFVLIIIIKLSYHSITNNIFLSQLPTQYSSNLSSITTKHFSIHKVYININLPNILIIWLEWGWETHLDGLIILLDPWRQLNFNPTTYVSKTSVKRAFSMWE